jgi:hypothetical protein
VAGHADQVEVAAGQDARHQLQRLLGLDAELGGVEPGGDVRVRLRVHVGVDAQRDGRLAVALARHGLDDVELLRRLHV